LILAQITALENENKVLKSKANKEAVVLNGKNIVRKKNIIGENV